MKDFHDWFEENYKAWLRMMRHLEKTDAISQFRAESITAWNAALEAANEARKAFKWEDAESAPKDGEDFLAKNVDGQRKIVFWDRSKFVDHQECVPFCVHEWMELP